MPQQEHFTSDSYRNQGPARGLRYLKEILDSIDASKLIKKLIWRRRNGRPGYSPRAMFRAWLCKYLLEIPTNVKLVERLKLSSGLREVCGFYHGAPSETAISRFTGRLTEYQDLVERCFAQITDEMREVLADLGDDVAIDSTSIESYSNPNRKTVTDPNAAWGVKHSARSNKTDKKDEEKTDWFFGYKLHTISDANHEIPLGMILTPGNASDMTMLSAVFQKAQETYTWFKPKHLIADRGYDSGPNHEYLIDQGVTPVIHIRKPGADDGMFDGVFNEKGEPTCMGMKPMVYVKTDPGTGHHLYRCRGEGCYLKEHGTKAITHCDTEEWFDPADNPRVLGPLPRESEEWKALYKKRMSIERIFKNTKHSRLLEGHLFRKMAKIRLHATISMLTYSATVLTRLRRRERNPRKIKVKLAA